MAEELDPAVVKKTQEILGSVIRKPPLTDKSLKKPPFRFLHDIITNVIKTSGFMKGLFPPEELQSDNIKDKDGKIAFLQKAIDVLELVSNQQLSVKPSKIVAGHEPQKTNEFLQALGNAVKNKLDSKEAVTKVLGEKAPKRTNRDRKASLDKKPVTSQRASDKTSRLTNKPADAGKKISTSSNNQVKSRDEREKGHSKSKDSKLKEREKSKERTRKRDDSKSREKGTTKDIQKKPPKVQPEQPKAEPEDSPIKNGHDNPADNTESTIEVPSPEKDAEPVALLNGEAEKSEQVEEPPVELKAEPEVEKPSEVTADKEEKPSKKEKEKSRRPPSAHAPRTPSARPVKAFPVVDDCKPLEGTSSLTADNEELLPNPDAALVSARPFTPSRPPSARPPSARPAPPKIRIRHIVENEEARPPSAKPVENVILDNKPPSDDEDDADFVVTEEKPKDEDASEMIVPSAPVAETPEEDQGSLVRQLLETKKDLEGGSQQPLSRKVEIDKSQMQDAARKRERDSSGKELEQLRHFIQTVSRTANPLGRMLDYLQEDIDAMKTELQMWREENRQNLMALRSEQNVTESILEPLRAQLDDLDLQVVDQLETNSMLKSTIFRNDERIQRMLTAINNRS